jgi:cell division protein FtsW
MVYSATSVPEGVRAQGSMLAPWNYLMKQFIAFLVGFGLLMVLKRCDYGNLQTYEWAFAPLGLVLVLSAVAFFTDPRRHRWIELGVGQLQPSELAKPALAVFLAWLVVRRQEKVNEKQVLGPFLLAMMVLAGIVLLGDLGTAIVLSVTAAAVLFVAGLNRRNIITLAVIGLIVGSAGLMSKEYRRERARLWIMHRLALIAPMDPTGALAKVAPAKEKVEEPHQARQSLIATGSGGVLGAGLMNGAQKLFYLPAGHTDYILGNIGEEMGLAACLALIAGYLIIMWRGLRIFWTAEDPFGQFLALGITVSIVFQAFFNMTVVLDLIPSKGLTLPLISYGGSSMVSTLISLGLLMSVSEQTG